MRTPRLPRSRPRERGKPNGNKPTPHGEAGERGHRADLADGSITLRGPRQAIGCSPAHEGGGGRSPLAALSGAGADVGPIVSPKVRPTHLAPFRRAHRNKKTQKNPRPERRSALRKFGYFRASRATSARRPDADVVRSPSEWPLLARSGHSEKLTRPCRTTGSDSKESIGQTRSKATARCFRCHSQIAF